MMKKMTNPFTTVNTASYLFSSEDGLCCVGLSTNTEGFDDFRGDPEVDVLMWLEKFEDAFALGRYGALDDKLKQQRVKANMLVHRLKDPAKSIITSGLSSSQLDDYNLLKIG